MSGTYVALVIGAGVASNLLLAGMFVARVRAPGHARTLGFAATAMAVPLVAASVEAAMRGMGPWEVALPLVFGAFAVEEVAVDLVAGFDVRRTRWLWPYLASFYLAQWAVIGAAFLASRPGGVAVLVSYFVCLAATAWSYRRVGHGSERATR